MSVLKTCPFCGSQPVVDDWISGDKIYYYVHCDNMTCKIQPSTDLHTAKNVVTREWNKRAKDN